MDKITRLLAKVKQARNGQGMHILGFVDYDPEKKVYTASGTIWNGVAGSGGEPFYSEHSTPDDALAACEAVAARYPNSENINFIMDNLMFPVEE